MIHPKTEVRFINEKVGYGVVATDFLPKGTITWVQDSLDRIFSLGEAEGLPKVQKEILDKFSFTNSRGEKVLCWDNAKFVNHSFRPSCFSTAYDFEIAIRDIYPGEELTDDYGYLNIEEPFAAMDEGHKRKIVYPDDLLTYYKEWDAMILDCLPYIYNVEQALLPILPASTRIEIERLKIDPRNMRSLLECYYPRSLTIQNSIDYGYETK
ncbi:SET domain-containing protein [Sphingobacterium siyangense]|uniref:SET domain-containing protein n=1 Tax=Sphingobacterium siyangense TaxID=459529 RepID=UPI0019656135|nr:SET domain-containing protein [Sphingobacterium siyangense]QRY55495.1 SET domain-containing protein [Sphingobacterium siyangense]